MSTINVRFARKIHEGCAVCIKKKNAIILRVFVSFNDVKNGRGNKRQQFCLHLDTYQVYLFWIKMHNNTSI